MMIRIFIKIRRTKEGELSKIVVDEDSSRVKNLPQE